MKRCIFTIVVLFSLFVGAHHVDAANLYVVPNKTTVAKNETFTATVFVNTNGVAINNSEGVLSFPSNLLSVESVSMTGSVFSIWVEQPSFSNNAGTVSFNGGVPNPGFNGTSGSVLRINFRAKNAGSATLAFNTAGIYANDGLGTNVSTPPPSTSVTITEAGVAPTTPTEPGTTPATTPSTPAVNPPPAPVVESSDLPDEESWYNKTKGVFSWDVPRDVTAVQLLLGSRPTSVPTVLYSPPIGNKELANLTDGVQYLHVRFRKGSTWGPTTHRKIQIDTTSPQNIVVTDSTNNGLVTIQVSAEDAVSGIKSYSVWNNGAEIAQYTVPENEALSTITLPPLIAGEQNITVRAYDKAGNSAESTITIIAPALEAPRILSYPESIRKGETIAIHGTSYPLTDIRVWTQIGSNTPEETVVTSNAEGAFSFTSPVIRTDGITAVWAEALRTAQVVSPPSPKVYVMVQKSSLMQISRGTFEVVYAIIPLIVVILALMFTTYLGFHKFRLMRAKLVRDLDKTNKDAHLIFSVIKDDLKQSIRLFEKVNKRRPLMDEEMEVLNVLQKDLDEAEKYFSERIKEIKKKRT